MLIYSVHSFKFGWKLEKLPRQPFLFAAVLMDVSKAFYVINYDLLIAKHHAYGVTHDKLFSK